MPIEEPVLGTFEREDHVFTVHRERAGARVEVARVGGEPRVICRYFDTHGPFEWYGGWYPSWRPWVEQQTGALLRTA
jgi:hypothetical protein